MNKMDKNFWVKLRCYFMLNARKRTNYLLKRKVFKSVGSGFVFFPRKIPQDPQFIKFGNNDVVATDVMFVNHDIIHEMLNGIKDAGASMPYKKKYGNIEIKDNVFIGARSMIMPNVVLGPDVVVAAGSVVTKSYGGGVIIGGNPARVIGQLDELKRKRLKESTEKISMTKDEEANWMWECKESGK